MPSWRQQQSEVVGGGQARHGSVFRALVPLVCAWCGGAVAVGETFTRSSHGGPGARGAGGALYVVCRPCGRKGPPPRTHTTKAVADGG